MNAITKTTPTEELRGQLARMDREFRAALPSHIRPDRFQRVVMTVVQQQPDLLQADRRSLLGACIKCAADGLIPDGREAALVVFRSKDGPKVQYMPMLAGVLKRMRNSGEIAAVNVQVVHANDTFVWRPADMDRPLEHEAPPFGSDRGAIIGAYAMARLKDGTVQVEVMDRPSIERVRAVSRSKDSGPWVQWWDQMARKTVLRRLAKYLPMDAEAERVIQADDEADAEAIDTTADLAPAAAMTAALTIDDDGVVDATYDETSAPSPAPAEREPAGVAPPEGATADLPLSAEPAAGGAQPALLIGPAMSEDGISGKARQRILDIWNDLSACLTPDDAVAFCGGKDWLAAIKWLDENGHARTRAALIARGNEIMRGTA